MEYAVPENDRPEAEDLLDIYREDRIGLWPCCRNFIAICRKHGMIGFGRSGW